MPKDMEIVRNKMVILCSKDRLKQGFYQTKQATKTHKVCIIYLLTYYFLIIVITKIVFIIYRSDT